MGCCGLGGLSRADKAAALAETPLFALPREELERLAGMFEVGGGDARGARDRR
jgi:hypothetical protein